MGKRKNCIVCKKPFIHAQTGRPRTRFCSTECNKKFYKGGKFPGQHKWNCVACKADFFRYIKNDGKQPIFCSRECAHRSNSLLAETARVEISKPVHDNESFLKDLFGHLELCKHYTIDTITMKDGNLIVTCPECRGISAPWWRRLFNKLRGR